MDDSAQTRPRYEDRWNQVQEHLADQDADLFVARGEVNTRYLCCSYLNGGSIVSAVLIPRIGEVALITSSLEAARVRDTVAIEKQYVVSPYPRIDGIAKTIAKGLDHVVEQMGAKKILSDRPWKLSEAEVEKSGQIEVLRAIKVPEEVDKLRRAADIATEGADYLPGLLQPGRTELDVAAELDRFMKTRGSERNPYDTIIASGPEHSAYPHHEPTSRKLQIGDLVVCDFGASVAGYVSDCTRTYGVGGVSDEAEGIYDIVLEAQIAGRDRVKAGMAMPDVDAITRDIINDSGWGDYFCHSTGHGIGLEVHEAPWVNPNSKDTVTKGQAFTIEPGIYKVGLGGVRIEDDMLVGDNDIVSMTTAPRELILT